MEILAISRAYVISSKANATIFDNNIALDNKLLIKLLYRLHDTQVYITGADPEFFPPKDCQFGSILQNHVANVCCRHNNNNNRLGCSALAVGRLSSTHCIFKHAVVKQVASNLRMCSFKPIKRTSRVGEHFVNGTADAVAFREERLISIFGTKMIARNQRYFIISYRIYSLNQ